MRLKDLVTVRNIKTDRTDLPYIALENIQSWDGTYVPSAIETEGINSMYFAGDVLFGKLRPYLAKAFIPDNNGICSTEFLVMKTGSRMNNQFLKYYLLSPGFIDYIKNQVAGVKMPRTNWNEIGSLSVNVPSIEKQGDVVAYLNNEIDTINKRIWLRERELQTLIKLKQSEIDAVVTRGLNPNVKMKDSGIDWIGQIPEHWEVRRFKEIFKSYTTGITPESKKADNFETEGGYPWITIADINDRKYVRSGALNLSEKVIQEFAPPLTKKGSLMFSFKLSIGKVAYADQDLYTNEAIVSIPPTKKQCFDYFYYVLPNVLMNNATENIYGAKMLNQKIISNMCFALPPKEEQEAIAKYLNEKFEEINKLISNINLQIEKLQLLKKSLINEVITGQRAI